jgi:hypothetical protein
MPTAPDRAGPCQRQTRRQTLSSVVVAAVLLLAAGCSPVPGAPARQASPAAQVPAPEIVAVTPSSPAGATAGAAPSDEASCTASAGQWQRAGRGGGFHCILTYADGGKPCRDGAECQGDCRTDPSVEFPPAGSSATGLCQADSNRFGCHASISNGRAGVAICVD